MAFLQNVTNFSDVICSDKDKLSRILHYFETLTLSVSVLLVVVTAKYMFLRNNYWKSLKNVTKEKTITTATIPQVKHFFSFRLPFIEGFYTLYRIRKDGVKVLEEWISKFGNLFEIPIGTITVFAVSDPTIAQKILRSSNPQHLNKPKEIYDRLLVEWFHDGLANSDYKTWSVHRKILSRSFTYKSLQHYLKYMNKHGKGLVKNLISIADNSVNNGNGNAPATNQGQPQPTIEGDIIYHTIYCHAIKIIAQIVMGADRLPDETVSEFTQNFYRFKEIIVDRFLNPILFFPPYWHFHPKKKEHDRLSNRLSAFFMRITRKYRKEFEETRKLLGNYKDFDEKHYDVGEKPFRCLIQEMLCSDLTDKEIYDEVGTIIGTGHESVVVSIKMLLLHLALNPGQQARCMEEIDKLINEKCDNSDVLDYEFSMDDLSNLKYLERCILESSRITPTLPIFLRKLDAPLKIDDKLTLPAGKSVAILPWTLHRDPNQFPNPEKFDSDRFLPENIKKRHPYAYMAYSAGPRNCIGNKMAIMEIKVIMTWILRCFEVFSTDKLEDVKMLFEVTLSPERNFNLIFKKRKFVL